MWSSGDPFLDGMYLAAELAAGLMWSFYVPGEGEGLFISDPEPRIVD